MRRILSVTALLWTLGASLGWCQETDQLPEPPQPQSALEPQQQPANSTPASNAGQSATPEQPVPPISPSTGQIEAAGPGVPQAEMPPLAGAEVITPELPGSSHSYILPSLSLWEGADSNAQLVPGMNRFEAATIPVGVLDLNITGRSNQFGVNLGGGGLIYESSLSRNAGFVQGGFTDTYTTRRWSFLLSDRISYLPEASAGFAGIGFGGAFNNAPFLGVGSGPTQLNPIFTPGQSVLVGQFAALSNIAIAQAQYQINSTNSVSVTGSFGIQHYEAASTLQSGNDMLTVLSWDRQLTEADTVSVSYALVRYRYNGGSVALNDNLWRLGYGRRVSHRMSFSALVGPQLIYSRVRLVPGVQKSLSAVAQVGLSYQLQRVDLSVGYLHYASPGSGVFQGANSDSVTGGMGVQLTRTWDLSLSLADSRNSRLGAYSINPAFPNPGAISYQYGTVRLSHVMGRYMRAFAVYDLQHQTSGGSFVRGSTSTGLNRHVIGIGFEVHPRPVGL
jgi:hypothetical protein